MADDTTKFWEMIDDIRVAMLTTEGSDGLESRPMSAYVDKAANAIWFITKLESDKTNEIKDDAHVNLAFSDSKANKYVSVTGTARIVRDPAKAKELWNPFAEAWLPEGPDAPTTGLLHVTPTHGTMWDSPGKIATLFRVAAANITQSPPKNDQVTKVTL